METRLILDYFVQAFADAEAIDCPPGSLPRGECDRRANAAIDPTPDEIRAATLEIQSNWSDRERTVRAGHLAAQHWRLPQVHVTGFAGDED